MARKEATGIDNKFIRGLITETTALSFPEDACTETWDCTFSRKGEITRRKGFDYETGTTYPSTVEIAESTSFVFTEFLWETSQGSSLKTFVVSQIGDNIYFYDVSSTTEVKDNLETTYTLALSDYLPTIAYYNPADYPCQYSQGNNQLIIVNKGIDPVIVSYDSASDSITAQKITIKYRDFDGLDDGLGITERPTESVATLITNNASHYYNILNQGWHATDALTQWDTARTDMPSNADQVNFYRSSTTDSFNNSVVDSYSALSNTPAPKGHFILELGNTSRTAALSAEGFSATIDGEAQLISAATGSIVGNATADQANAFDGTTSQVGSSSARTTVMPTFISTAATSAFFIGKDYSASPKQIIQADVYAPSNTKFTTLTASFSSIVVQLRGHTSAPTTGVEGTLLGETTLYISGLTNGQQISIGSSDTSTAWEYVWIAMFGVYAAGTTGGYMAEVEFYTPTSGAESVLSYNRPSTTAFFAGRAWYAGIEDGDLNNNIYFSRIVLQDEDYGKCYQANDPTSEFVSDLLPDDGGVLRIIEVSRIVRLVPFQNSLLVFATNGVWRISSTAGSGGGFQANDYALRQISDIGLDAVNSLVLVDGTPFWFGEQGIYTIQYNSNYDAFSVSSLTDTTIKSFIQDIPRANRKHIKGAYDKVNNVIQWLYNADDSPSGDYIYNRILNMNTLTGAFYPYTISEVSQGPTVRGIIYVRDSDRTVNGVIKYPTTILDTTTDLVYFSEILDTSYVDWATESENVDYTSYFITGYKLHGETQKFFQIKYLMVFLTIEDNASCYVQNVSNFTNSTDSKEWGRQQQVYAAFSYKDVSYRRLKIRGRGRSIQLKFTSESGKPFTIIGWSLSELANANT